MLEPVGAGLNFFPAGNRVLAAPLGGETLTGRFFSTRSWTGRPYVVNVWGSWCGPCREEAPGLAAAAGRLASEGVGIVGVDTEDVRSAAIQFLRDYRVAYPSLFDPLGRIKSHYRYPAIATPTTYVIDGEGRIAAVVYGRVTGEQIVSVVDRVRQHGND